MKEDRQIEIIKAYYQVVANEGFENASLAKISKLINIPTSLIFHYFQNKKDLTIKFVEYFLDMCTSIAIPEINLKNHDYSSEFINYLDELFCLKGNRDIDSRVYYAVYELGQRDEQVKEMLSMNNARLRFKIEDCIKYFIDKRVITSSDSLLTADYLHTIIEGLSILNEYYGNEDHFLKLVELHKEEFKKYSGFIST